MKNVYRQGRPRYSKQRGDFLLEALVGMVLMAIISMGVVFVTSKASVAQRDMQVQEIAVNQMRSRLQSGNNLCAANQTLALPGNGAVAVATRGCDGTTQKALTATVKLNDVPKGSVGEVRSPVIMSANVGAAGCANCDVVVGGEWSAQ